jgi:hypothetical protein
MKAMYPASAIWLLQLSGSPMSKTKREWIDHVNSLIQDAERFCVLTRESAFQRDAAKQLKELRPLLAALKAQAIEREDEDFANLLLGFECSIDCRFHELKMWIALKDGEPDMAWDHLIAAQDNAMAGPRAHHGFEHLAYHVERLEKLELLLFPPQVFVSAGLVVKTQECTICGMEYDECEHLVGLPYWGKFCAIITRGLEFNHMAIVKNPADKRCRILGIPSEAGNRNRMSWKLEPLKGGADQPTTSEDGAVTVSASILRAGN